MKKNIGYISLTIALTFIVGACGTSIIIEKQKGFFFPKRIISIEPMFDVLIEEGDNNGNTTKSVNDFVDAKRRQEALFSYMAGGAANSQIELEIIKSDNIKEDDKYYFQYLVPLKKEILDVNQLQEFEGKNNKFLKKGTVITYYNEGPKIKDYSILEDAYGSRYFAVQGIQVSKRTVAETPESEKKVVSSKYYYAIIADVVTSQIVYSEYRILKPKTSENSLKNIIYDSFSLIKR